MLFVLPFRAKNPSPVFPSVTVGLIVLNTLLFARTCDSHLQGAMCLEAEGGLRRLPAPAPSSAH